MLEVRNLTKRYGGFTALFDVSYEAHPGRVCGYLGPNGSGKSTTIKILTGMMPPTSGGVLYNGQDIRDDLMGYKSVLGYVPEEPHLYTYLTGYEYLQLVADLRCLSAPVVNQKLPHLLRLFSLESARYDPIAAYSKGMKQKVLIAAALLHNPDVYVFDEPVSGLDITASLIFRSIMKSLAKAGKIVICSSHEMALTEAVCSEVMIISKGRIVGRGSVQELRQMREMASLEEVFAHLVVSDNVDVVAAEIVSLTVES